MANVFSLRNSYGAGIADKQRSEANALSMRAGEQNIAMNERAMAREEKQYDENQQMENTKFVAEGARAVLENPARWSGFVREGKRRGIFKPEFNHPFDEAKVREGLAAAEGALAGYQPQRGNVSRTWINPDTGTMWALSADGQAFDTQVPAQQFAQKPIQTGEGTAAFDPGSASVGDVLPGTEAGAMRSRAQADAQAKALGSGRGQAQAALEADAPKKAERAETAMESAKNVNSVIDRAISNATAWTTGLAGSTAKNIPGTPAFDLSKDLETIKANLGFDRLQRMREESKTGGALGQVAVQELVALQSTVRSLEQSQSREQFVSNLQAVKAQYTKAINAYNAAKSQDITQIQSDEEYNALPSGTEFIGPDGKRRRKP